MQQIQWKVRSHGKVEEKHEVYLHSPDDRQQSDDNRIVINNDHSHNGYSRELKIELVQANAYSGAHR